MTTVAEIIRSSRKRRQKLGDIELRKLPDRMAMIHGRLSGFRQVKDSKESVKEIAYLVDLVKADGYQTHLEKKQVEEWLENIQAGKASPGVLQDGQLIINCLGLGISGSLSEDKRQDLDVTVNFLEKKELGAIYVTEGANRLSRDSDRVVSAKILKLMKDSNCKLRTPYEILSPCIDRDWEIIHTEFERGADELKGMNRRLLERRNRKAARGEFVGEPILPGFIVTVIGTRSNGSRIYGKYQGMLRMLT